MNIAVIPPGDVFNNNELFKLDSGINRDNALYPYFIAKKKLKERGIRLETYDMYTDYNDIDIVMFYNINYNIDKLISIVKINSTVGVVYFMTEPVVVNSLHTELVFDLDFIDKTLTWNDNYTGYDNAVKIVIPNPSSDYTNNLTFDQKKEICMINSNKSSKHIYELYSERVKAIKYFGKKKLIDLYGMGWEKYNDDLIKTVYKGTVKNKSETYSKYKFSICYENSYGELGYITEKLFDSISAGCVPVYYGPKNINKYIPHKCFIDFREFSNSYKKLEKYLIEMDVDEYSDYQYNIRTFMESSYYKRFTENEFVNTLEKVFTEVMNKNNVINKSIKLNSLKGILVNRDIKFKHKIRMLLNYFKAYFS